jgi:multidrug efflux system membrane fusion protein
MNGVAKGAIALVAAAVCGGIVTTALEGTPAPASPSPPSVGSAAIVRTDLSSTVLTQGTLGYAPSPPVVNELAGTYTDLLPAGTVVLPGQVLYRVDNQPVILMSGTTPAWRSFGPGMSDGPDVDELEQNLIALGDARGLLSVPGPHFGAAAGAAVERWQLANGMSPTGSIALGNVGFVPEAVRISSASVAVGQPASPGDLPYHVTTTTRSVAVPLTPADPEIVLEQAVSIDLPSGVTTDGHVSDINLAPASATSSSSSTPIASVTPAHPGVTGSADGETVQVSLTVDTAHHVLAVPIAALLALAGGGYGLELAGPGPQHRLVGVRVGVFAGGMVQIVGGGLVPGMRVEVAQ